MRRLLSLTVLFVVSLLLSLGLARLSNPWGLKPFGMRLALDPNYVAFPMTPAADEAATIDARGHPPDTPRDSCAQGDWRVCLDLAAEDPPDRGTLLRRAERQLDRLCHNRGWALQDASPPKAALAACGQLAAIQMARSPRLVAEARDCLNWAIRDCHGCDLAETLPPAILVRPEWSGWCAAGDEIACQVEDAARWVGPTSQD